MNKLSPTPGKQRLDWACYGLALLVCGCGRGARAEAPTRDYRVSVTTESDPEQRLPGVVLTAPQPGSAVSRSDASGVASLVLNGAEGANVPIQISCPAGYVAPAEPLMVVLRTLANGAIPELVVSCLPSERSLVVVVRLEGGGAFPIVENGHTIGQTDELGVAHLLYRGAPGDKHDLTIDTSRRPELKPGSPSGRFVIGSRDDFYVYDKKLIAEVKKRRAAPQAAKAEGPKRLK